MTTQCHDCRDLIGGYVLDALEPDEMTAVRAHLQTCSPCAQEHAELAAIPVLLDLAESADAVPERPPARLEEAVLDRFARERRAADEAPAPAATPTPPSRRARRLARPRFLRPGFALTALAAAAVAVAIVVGTGALSGDDDAPGGRVWSSQLSAASFIPGATGEAKLYAGPAGTSVHLTVDGLKPPAGHAYNYELWCVRSSDGWKISAGTFRVDSQGHADVRLTTAAKPSEYDQLSIQARPVGVNPAQSGERVLVGPIQS